MEKLTLTPETKNFLFEGYSEYIQKAEIVFNLLKVDVNTPISIVKNDITNKDSVSIPYQQVKLINFKSEETDLSTLTSDSNLKIVFDPYTFYYSEDKELQKRNLSTVIKSLKNLGTFYFMVDIKKYKHIDEIIMNFLEQNPKTNLLIKLFIIEKINPIVLMSIQKFDSKQEVDIKNIKVRMSEIILKSDNINEQEFILNQSIDVLLTKFVENLNYVTSLYHKEIYLSRFRPGEMTVIEIKSEGDVDRIAYTLLVIDSENHLQLEKNKCSCLIINCPQANNYYYLSKGGYQDLLNDLDVSRILIVKPSSFIREDSELIKNKLSPYINQFTPLRCRENQIQGLSINDNRSDKQEVFTNDNFIITDIKEIDKPHIFRTITSRKDIYQTQILAEVNITLVGNKDSKATNLVILPTPKHFENRQLKSTLNQNHLTNYDYHFALCSLFFIEELPKIKTKKEIDIDLLEKELSKSSLENKNEISKSKDIKEVFTPELLILNAGAGILPYFASRIFNDSCNITSVEPNSELTDLGEKYMGLASKNITKVKSSYIEYLSKTNKKIIEKFDIVSLVNINVEDYKDIISPSSGFFDDEIISNLSKIIKDSGVFVLKINAVNYVYYENAISKLKKHFDRIYYIENSDNLNRIHYLCKKKLPENKILYLDIFQKNLEFYNQSSDDTLNKEIIGSDHKNFFEKMVLIS